MQPEMTPHEIANEIYARQIHCRIYGEGETFVMVEGKTDEVLWEEYRSRDDCTLYPAYGKDRIIDALQVANRRDMRGVAGIVDADYWLITEADELGTENLLYDDCCPDMESILLSSPVLDKLLRNNLFSFEIDDIRLFVAKLKENAYRLAAEFGYFRLLNEIRCYGLTCNAIPLADVIEVNSLEFDARQVAARLTGGRTDITGDDLLQQVDQLRQRYSPDGPQLCRGKDIVAIIAHILPTLFEAQFEADLPPDSLLAFNEKALGINLRSAYDSRYFKMTSLFGCIRNWESDNPCYKILAEDI